MNFVFFVNSKLQHQSHHWTTSPCRMSWVVLLNDADIGNSLRSSVTLCTDWLSAVCSCSSSDIDQFLSLQSYIICHLPVRQQHARFSENISFQTAMNMVVVVFQCFSINVIIDDFLLQRVPLLAILTLTNCPANAPYKRRADIHPCSSAVAVSLRSRAAERL